MKEYKVFITEEQWQRCYQTGSGYGNTGEGHENYTSQRKPKLSQGPAGCFLTGNSTNGRCEQIMKSFGTKKIPAKTD